MEEEKQVKSNKKKIVIGMVVVLLVIVIIVLAMIIYKLLHKEPEERGTVASVTTEESQEEDSTFTTDMNMVWSFPSGKRTSNNAVIGNSEYNKHDVYFEVYLDDEEQTLLYSSPILPIGKRLDKLKLNKALPDGQHEAICTFHLLDDDDPEKEISRISFNVTLVFM